MAQWYVQLVMENPVWSAMVQFAVLGTLGDLVSRWIAARKVFMPFDPRATVLKMLQWALLAIGIKYAFTGFGGFVDALTGHSLLPVMDRLGRAFAISVAMNLQFGPFLVMAHRLLDNAIARKTNWDKLDKSMLSLLWFWIPAHTVTFTLARPFQIGLAALWCVVFGLILGFYNRRNQPVS
ncbi:MAG: hypothetical protein HY796_08045 [Elusimicrobia bacterium]|nr:hypothetical protein [Elusimicrobiota bacterium]